jgi:hypothetical protein
MGWHTMPNALKKIKSIVGLMVAEKKLNQVIE